MVCQNFIKKTFLKLTSKTYPFGFEDVLLEECKYLFPNLERDVFGNYYYKIGNSRTVFASHLDTACKNYQRVNHVIDGDTVKTDGTTILGADDKAGVTLLLWLIQNKIPGLYYFFIGEEVGCIGSGKASTLPIFKDYDRIVSFDRRGTESVITHQSYTRTCSDEFANALAKQLNQYGDLKYEIDDTGVYTDSAEFTQVISECTNISVGYYSEHTTKENQDLNHLTKLALSIVDVEWEKLPTSRDPKVKEYKDWKEYDYGTYVSTSYTKSKKRNRRGNKNHKGRTYIDRGNGEYEEFEYESYKSNKSLKNLVTDRDHLRYGERRTYEDFKLSIPTHTLDSFTRKMIYEREISKDELVKLSKMIFDMNNPEDVKEYNYLLSVVW
jgi:hypothetical protein